MSCSRVYHGCHQNFKIIIFFNLQSVFRWLLQHFEMINDICKRFISNKKCVHISNRKSMWPLLLSNEMHQASFSLCIKMSTICRNHCVNPSICNIVRFYSDLIEQVLGNVYEVVKVVSTIKVNRSRRTSSDVDFNFSMAHISAFTSASIINMKSR